MARQVIFRGRLEVDPIMLMYAFRYALGRKTYAVSDVANALIEHRDKLRPDWRAQVVREIGDAQSLGMDCDEEQWSRVVEAMRD